MKALVLWRPTKLSAGVLLTLAVVLSAPTGAHGSCGDYVRMGGAAHKTLAGPAAPQHTLPVPAGNHLPCSGPTCSRGRQTPPLVPPASPSSSAEEWGCTAAVTQHAASGPFACVIEELSARPVLRGSEIYHPPR
jgi:hypothetical protein